MADRPALLWYGPCTVSTTLSVEKESSLSSTTRLQDPACYPGTGIFSVASLSYVCMKTVPYVCCPSIDVYCQVVLCMQAFGMTLVDPMELPACLPSQPAYLTSRLRGIYLFCTTNSIQATTTSIPMIYQGVIGSTATTSRSCLLWLPEPSSTLHWVSSWLDLDRQAVGRPRELPSSASC